MDQRYNRFSQAESDSGDRNRASEGEGAAEEDDPFYLDIDDCIADLTRVDVRFNEAENYLGFLAATSGVDVGDERTSNETSEADSLPAQATVRVPLCIATKWYLEDRLSTLDFPFLSEKYMSAMKMDYTIDINSFNKLYFDVGMKIARTMKNDELRDTLLEVSRQRSVLISKIAREEVLMRTEKRESARHAGGASVDVESFLRGLTLTEREVYGDLIARMEGRSE
eukprot:GHVU01135391.1.p1 GENE.GHVU01135391.1~~GHVU01135391.1.p1  ORF type:complete len:225 (+),score=32.57 GHVU01135391.1:203-877(+)